MSERNPFLPKSDLERPNRTLCKADFSAPRAPASNGHGMAMAWASRNRISINQIRPEIQPYVAGNHFAGSDQDQAQEHPMLTNPLATTNTVFGDFRIRLGISRLTPILQATEEGASQQASTKAMSAVPSLYLASRGLASHPKLRSTA